MYKYTVVPQKHEEKTELVGRIEETFKVKEARDDQREEDHREVKQVLSNF